MREAWQTITSTALLNELPLGAVIRESDGAIQERKSSDSGPRWFQTGWTGGRNSEWIHLPALVIWHPGWLVGTCKHCGIRIEIRPERSASWLHAEGLQQGRHTCALEPYGFRAEPEGTPCSDNPANPCNGSRNLA